MNRRKDCHCFSNDQECSENHRPGAYTVAVSGRVSGVLPQRNVPIIYTINGITNTVYTDHQGYFIFRMSVGSNVAIMPGQVDGYAVSPEEYRLTNVTMNISNQNFVYAPKTVTLGGKIIGLANPSDVAVNYRVNEIVGIVYADRNGHYSITVPMWSNVEITPSLVADYTVFSPVYRISKIFGDLDDLDFVYSVDVSEIVLHRAVSVIPEYGSPPNAWPVHGEIMPELYMTDRVLILLPPSNPISVKWTYGQQDMDYFLTGGMDITDSYNLGVPAGINGVYTIYARMENGFEGIATIEIDNLRDGTAGRPYLLIDFNTASSRSIALPDITAFTLCFMQGGGKKLSDHYELYEDIQMAGRTWMPLGVTENVYPYSVLEGFTGSLDGNGHSIENLTLGNALVQDNQGFFRALLDGAQVRNLNLSGCNVSSEAVSAGLAAIVNIGRHGEIRLENISFSGSVHTNVYAAGLVGMSDENNGVLSIVGCSVNGDIVCSQVAGGIAGYLMAKESGSILVDGCVASGSVQARGDNAAGMIALAVGSGRIRISSCYNSGSGWATAGVGGMCAEYNGSASPDGILIENCYNSGVMTMASGHGIVHSGVGGIIGRIKGIGVIRNCYNVGDVLYPNTAGTIGVGGISGNYGEIQTCVAINELIDSTIAKTARISPNAAQASVSSLVNNLAYENMRILIGGAQKSSLETGSSGRDGISTPVSAIKTEALYASTLGWDFSGIWSFGNRAYLLPILRSIPANLQPTELPEHLR